MVSHDHFRIRLSNVASFNLHHYFMLKIELMLRTSFFCKDKSPFLIGNEWVINFLHHPVLPLPGCWWTRTTDTQWEFFSMNIPNIFDDLEVWPIKFWGILEYFRQYYLLKFCHCVSPVRDFALLRHFFCKKLMFSCILQKFLFGIEI